MECVFYAQDYAADEKRRAYKNLREAHMLPEKAFHWAQKCKIQGFQCESNRNILKDRSGCKIFGCKST